MVNRRRGKRARIQAPHRSPGSKQGRHPRPIPHPCGSREAISPIRMSRIAADGSPDIAMGLGNYEVEFWEGVEGGGGKISPISAITPIVCWNYLSFRLSFKACLINVTTNLDKQHP